MSNFVISKNLYEINFFVSKFIEILKYLRLVILKFLGQGKIKLQIFRQHAASIYGFVRFVSLVRQKKNLKCNISLTEAQIFMKFVTYVYEIVFDHPQNFHKDPCKDARARGVNARTHVKKNLCVRSLG